MMIMIITNGQRILTKGDMQRDCSLGKYNVTLDCFCGWPVAMRVNSMRGNPDVGPLGIGLGQRAGKYRHHAPQKCPFPMEVPDPYLMHSSSIVQPFLQG